MSSLSNEDSVITRSVSSSELTVKRVILNVRGIKFDVMLETLDRIPGSRLAKLKNCIDKNDQEVLGSVCDDFDMSKSEFYFNRDHNIFNLVLNLYSTLKLHIDRNHCVMLLNEEFAYWGIDEKNISNCCEWNFRDLRDEVQSDMDKEREVLNQYIHKEKFDNFYFAGIREKLWNLFEKPHSSLFAKVTFLYADSIFLFINMIQRYLLKSFS